VSVLDAGTLIPDLNQDLISLAPGAEQERLRAIRHSVHRLHRIVDKVDQRLLNLHAVGLNHRQTGFQLRFDDDAVVTQIVRKHTKHLGDNLVHIQERLDRCRTPRMA
jgi:hypothetical protein